MKMELYTKGLGNKVENCQIVSHESNQGDGFTKCSKDGEFPPLSPNYSVRAEIEVQKLDDVMGDRFALTDPSSQRIGVLKIDIEGFEVYAFQGGLKFIKSAKIPFIVAEIGLEGKELAKQFITILDDLGYELRVGKHKSSAKALRVEDIQTFVSTVDEIQDVVFVLREWMKDHPESKASSYWP